MGLRLHMYVALSDGLVCMLLNNMNVYNQYNSFADMSSLCGSKSCCSKRLSESNIGSPRDHLILSPAKFAIHLYEFPCALYARDFASAWLFPCPRCVLAHWPGCSPQCLLLYPLLSLRRSLFASICPHSRVEFLAFSFRSCCSRRIVVIFEE